MTLRMSAPHQCDLPVIREEDPIPPGTVGVCEDCLSPWVVTPVGDTPDTVVIKWARVSMWDFRRATQVQKLKDELLRERNKKPPRPPRGRSGTSR